MEATEAKRISDETAADAAVTPEEAAAPAEETVSAENTAPAKNTASAEAAVPAESEAPAEEAAPAKKAPAETMQDMEKELEASYSMMGDGEHDTDALLAWAKIMELYEAKTDLTVEISGVVNKGVIAEVEGIRGFIPASRLSLRRVDDLNEWLGREIRVRIITADRESDKLVLSAREILKEERDNVKKQKLAAVEVGSIFDGTVDSIQDYGVFVDLGDGISGLVHVSQIALERVKHPSDVLKQGQEVRVKVIGKQDGKLKLSMKALLEQNKREEEVSVKIPKAESIGTSMGDLLKNLKL
ncbi:MAG: S1 RNA-binding domain-containing protein [Clostridiales bacterium]|nr:S1 RNA-binding domain-containing protein [Clostridiales bacterium]